jgi:hypothetical protein
MSTVDATLSIMIASVGSETVADSPLSSITATVPDRCIARLRAGPE